MAKPFEAEAMAVLGDYYTSRSGELGLIEAIRLGLAKAAREALISPPLTAGTEVMDGWQTMESAPKDGTLVDLWVEWLDGPRRRANCKWSGSEEEGWELGDGSTQHQYSEWPNVTHWRPLPDPPAPESKP